MCGKILDYHDVRPLHAVKSHCSIQCARKDKDVIDKMKRTVHGRSDKVKQQLKKQKQESYKRILENDPDFWKRRAEKSKKTRFEHYGDENYMSFGSPEFKNLMKERHGDKNYHNIQKAIQTRLNKSDEEKAEISRRQQESIRRHKEADPEFAKQMLEKSIATRKRNNGKDYTGRAKCKATLQRKYGVDNPYKIEAVREKVKQHNLEKYGVEYYSSTPECREKVANTCMNKYGATTYTNSEVGKAQIKQHNLEKHGVEHSWQREDVKQKIKETNLRKYGTESAMQNHDVRVRAQMRYTFDNRHFDSLPEIALYVWLKDHNEQFEYQPDVKFEFVHEDVTHFYHPDFKISNELYELKGCQFFKNKDVMTNIMVNPYDHSFNALYEAKHQCMLKNGVKILSDNDYKMYLDYLKKKFTPEQIKSFRNVKNDGEAAAEERSDA